MNVCVLYDGDAEVLRLVGCVTPRRKNDPPSWKTVVGRGNTGRVAITTVISYVVSEIKSVRYDMSLVIYDDISICWEVSE